ncbi:MAG: methyltransferase domain-containing protein [Gammaproteobacteria bacterium]|nr:methyltransferase domain-containing protein [Gammaproteobacteria bacterium]MDH5514417.1 methyltransferase domain-containing protein [Gammaproteobacteria bacterium]
MDVTEYLRRSRAGENLLYSACDERTSIQVHEFANERWVYTGDNSILSLMRLDAPADPVLPNHVAMLAAILFSRLPARVLNLGFGTGAFERFFADRLPDTQVVSVDTSPLLVDIARQFFAIGTGQAVITQSAESFLDENSRTFDLILCDIFNGDRHPDCLGDEAFYRDAARSLGEGGVMAFNLSPATEQALLNILLTMRRSFAHVVLANLVDYGNIVVYAMQHRPADDKEIRRNAARRSTRLQLQLEHIPDQITVLPDTPEIHDGRVP